MEEIYISMYRLDRSHCGETPSQSQVMSLNLNSKLMSVKFFQTKIKKENEVKRVVHGVKSQKSPITLTLKTFQTIHAN